MDVMSKRILRCLQDLGYIPKLSVGRSLNYVCVHFLTSVMSGNAVCVPFCMAVAECCDCCCSSQ